MSLQEASTSRDVQHSESQDDYLQATSKRRRLSPSTESAAGAGLPSACNNFADDDDDGCPTPPRESQSPSTSLSSLDSAEAEPMKPWATAAARERPPDHNIAPTRDTHHTSGAGNGDPNTAESTKIDKLLADASQELAAKPKKALQQAAPLEYDLALIKFTAQDVALRNFMTTGISKGVLPSCRRFYELRGGSKPMRVYDKLTKWRTLYRKTLEGLTSTSRTTRTTAWPREDLRWLEDCESRKSNKNLKSLHDEVFVGVQDGSAGAAPAASSAQSRPLTRWSDKAGAGLVSNAPSSFKPKHSLSFNTDHQLAAVEAQLNKQQDQLTVLHAQNAEQGRLLAERSELLSRQAQQAERQAKQAKLQDEKLDCQMAKLERSQQLLQSFPAAQQKHN